MTLERVVAFCFGGALACEYLQDAVALCTHDPTRVTAGSRAGNARVGRGRVLIARERCETNNECDHCNGGDRTDCDQRASAKSG